MNTFSVTLCRVENKVMTFDIEAANEEEAREKGNLLFDNEELDWSEADCVHAQEFVNDVF